jgi:crossover junction endodeoxyribonuclease RusA
MDLAFRVIGRPVPQGSMVASYNRKMGVAHVHHVQGAALSQWRNDVRNGAIQAGAVLTTAPVAIYISFGMPRPKAHTTLRYGKYVVRQNFVNHLPSVQPDLDKLVRAVMDALTGIAYSDDAQVVTILAEKRYAEFTEIAVGDAWRPGKRIPMAQTANAAKLVNFAEIDPREGQLPLQDLWETGGE